MQLNPTKVKVATFRKGLNQRKVTELSGLSYSAVNSVYNGKSTTEETARKIAEVLGVSLETIKAKGER